MKYILPFSFIMLLLLAACTGSTANRPLQETESSPGITVFKAPI